MCLNIECVQIYSRTINKMPSLTKTEKLENSENPNVIMHCTNFDQLQVSLSFPKIFIPKDLKTALKNDLKTTNTDGTMTKNYVEFLKSLQQIKSIEQENYVFLFKILLYIEQFAQSMEVKKHKLMKHKITQNLYDKIKFNMDVPTLNIDNPFIKVEDKVCIEQSTEDTISNKDSKRKKFYAKVIKISDRNIDIIVSEKFAKTYTKDMKFNISFECSNWLMKCYHYILSLVNHYDLVSLMFPRIRNNQIQSNLDLLWFNKFVGQNFEQKQAIGNILNMTAYPAPYVLFGPPGTGKTATLVELICQIWQQGNSKCVLVCGSSNAAVDEIAIRLLKYINPNEMHRMYSRSKKWCDVPFLIQPIANFVDDINIFLPKDILIFKRIVLVTLSTCARFLKGKFRENHFSYIIIDEASQAIEPETIIPFMLSCTKDTANKGSLQAQVVVVGDHYQLGPFVQSKIAQPLLGKSMLERFMDLPLYKKGKDKKYDPCYITKLIKNYRSHKNILHVSNKEFYDGELVTCGGAVTTAAIGWSQLPNKEFPLIFHAVIGKEEREKFSSSVYNLQEISIAIKYVKLLMAKKLGTLEVKQEHLGIITPFKSQQIKIKKELQKRGWRDIDVGTVELFQGQEKEIIIFTTVRSQIFNQNKTQHIGFLSNEKRFNVALTRAKSLLIIIGNPRVLNIDKYWRTLIQYCIDNKAYIEHTSGFEKSHLKNKNRGHCLIRYN